MKTAMHELIAIIKDHRDNYKGEESLRVKKAYADILCAIDDFNLLEKEKHQVVCGICMCGCVTKEQAEQYYNETLS